MNQEIKEHNKSSLWNGASMVVLALLAGFIGGIAANRLDNRNAFLEQPETRQQVVSSESDLIADIASKVSPSVVSINVETQQSNLFFGTFSQAGAGTGVIISKNGLVLTNRHVIPENVTSVQVVLSDGTVYDDVTVVDRDSINDVAFLKINDVSDLPAAVLGDSDTMRVGDKVIAIGNALGEFDNTVTTGIISGQGRPIIAGDGFDSEQLQNLFQTDAAINPGNSGGPLMNLNGEVIAINTAVAGGAENIGFAIPINDIKPLVSSVEKDGKIIRPYLGVRYISLTPSIAKELETEQTSGAYLLGGDSGRAVIGDSPADKAGLKAEDIIIKVNDRNITAETPLISIMSRFTVNEKVTLTYIRDGQELTVEVTLEAAPEGL